VGNRPASVKNGAMCYGDDASPPLPPIRGGAGDYGDTVLVSADGTRFGAYYAHPDRPTNRAMVVLPDVRGLHGFYKELARRFAEAGLHSIAIDYFGRTAGIGERDEGFEYRPHVQQMQPRSTSEDVAAAVAWLRSEAGGGARSIFTVGFCRGGAISWEQAANGHGLSGCIGFYGIPARVIDRVPEMRAPLLLLVAGADMTPRSEFENFDRVLTEAGRPHEMYVYDGAPHSFFDRSFEEHQEACEDAWRRVLAFVDQHG
jgi:carboxymethylenebutenolidase